LESTFGAAVANGTVQQVDADARRGSRRSAVRLPARASDAERQSKAMAVGGRV